jgi:LysM repeat protein
MISADNEQRRSSYLGLVSLLVGLLLGAVVLEVAAGPPHLPTNLLDWNEVGAILRGSSLPLDVLAYILSMAAWALWLWIVASLLLRVIVLVTDAILHGAAWVATLRAVSDRVTLPVVRRAVDGALVAVFVVNVASRAVSGAAAASLPAVATPHVAAVRPHATMSGSDAGTRNGHTHRQDASYTVQAGDTLWAIAQRFYGTGYEFPRLVAANVGRQMTKGERFTAAGVIQPGWVLRIPLPSQTVTEFNGGHYYAVEEGDTMQGIAARLLGSDARWRTLFDANRGTARLDGQVLTDPDLIWPGLRLKLPADAIHVAPPHPYRAGQHTAPRPEKPRKNPPRRRLSPTPVEPTPTLSPPTPTSQPAVATSTPTASSGPAVSVPGNETDLIVGAAGVAAATAAGGAALVARRRVRRSLTRPELLPTGCTAVRSSRPRVSCQRCIGSWLQVESLMLLSSGCSKVGMW